MQERDLGLKEIIAKQAEKPINQHYTNVDSSGQTSLWPTMMPGVDKNGRPLPTR